MEKILLLAIVFLAFIASILRRPVLEFEPEEDGYFGEGPQKADDVAVVPFKVQVGEEVLKDLKYRLEHSRIGHESLNNDFSYGMNSQQLLKLKEYWLSKYDWRKFEAVFNSFPNFKTQIEGLQIHFIRSKPASGYKKVLPVLIVHGWPGNVFEFYKFIPILNDPKKFGINVEFAFEVIAPSIPGYGWSEQPRKTGFSQLAAARIFRKLMQRLGHHKFYLQGGDWGAFVTRDIAAVWPETVYGLHVNTIITQPGTSFLGTVHEIVGSLLPKVFFSSEKINYNFFSKAWSLIVETGYMHLQATKPDTVGTALNDSPIGLAAYIIEKFSTWTNMDYRKLPDGGLNRKFTNDELLTIVMVYWINGNIVSSQRFYRECFADAKNQAISKRYVKVPTGHASGINELYDGTPVELSKYYHNITHHTEIDMGHFAALEAPKPLAESLFQFVGDLEKL